MSISIALKERSANACELCKNDNTLSELIVSPKSGNNLDEILVVCTTCKSQIENPETVESNHWRCINESMWSEHNVVKVVSYRMLQRLKSEEWANDLLATFYMDELTKEWAEHGMKDATLIHKDVNGNVLNAGDSVTLIQDLNVKGAKFTAKRGTSVKRIRLVPDNPEHIEGKIEGQQIVILTKFVKKS